MRSESASAVFAPRHDREKTPVAWEEAEHRGPIGSRDSVTHCNHGRDDPALRWFRSTDRRYFLSVSHEYLAQAPISVKTRVVSEGASVQVV